MKDIDYLHTEKLERLIKQTENLKHKLIILLMSDCGLRVSEAITLTFQNFNFKTGILKTKTLKRKAGQEAWREVPISERIKETFYLYLEEVQRKGEKIAPNEYVFKSHDKTTHYSRISVWKFLNEFKEKNIGFDNLHPHALRHTFATQAVSNGVSIYEVKTLLGHDSITNTEIYAKIPTEILKRKTGYRDKQTAFQKLKHLIFPKREIIINIPSTDRFTVGRKKEIIAITNLLLQGTNVALIGKKGTGKSHLIDEVKNNLVANNKKVLVFDEIDNIKKTLLNCLLYLYDNDKEAVKKVVYGDFDTTQLKQRLTKESVKNLCDEIIKITNKKEFYLIIDDITRATPKSIKVLEELHLHFTTILAAREVTVSKNGFLWGYEIVRVEPLKREESLELIHKLSYDLDIESPEIYKNHIHAQTNGNPLAIIQMVERYRQEPYLTIENVRRITHYGSLKEIDLTPILLVALICIISLKYIGKEIDQNYQLLAGIGMVMFLLSRLVTKFTTRKTI